MTDTVDGEEWKAEAALYQVHLSHVREPVLTVTERHAINSLALLDKEGNDAADIVDRLQLDVVTEVFLGDSTNSLASNQQQFRTATETLRKIACLRKLLGKFGIWLEEKYLAPQAVRFIQDYQNTMAGRAFLWTSNSVASLTCLIDDLIFQGKSRRDIRNAVTSILNASKDTCATALAFAVYEIAKRPHVFAKLKAEMEKHLLSLQNREDLGADDASAWRLERWETWKPKSKWEFVPFNHGLRICLSQQLADVQMEYSTTGGTNEAGA
ncbi:cytochrome P450 [Phaeosphaeriaceae sp. PMI808]|nr:cytochrome P450 [Phaeosphaeriaceae sp. PMI808]